jgi:hypothetical protein
MSDQAKCMIRPGCENPPASSFPWDGAVMLACNEHAKTAIATAKRMGRVIQPLPLAIAAPPAPTKPPAPEPPPLARPSRSSSTSKPGR